MEWNLLINLRVGTEFVSLYGGVTLTRKISAADHQELSIKEERDDVVYTSTLIIWNLAVMIPVLVLIGSGMWNLVVAQTKSCFNENLNFGINFLFDKSTVSLGGTYFSFKTFILSKKSIEESLKLVGCCFV